MFRVALSNRRIESLENGHVTFRFRESESGEWKRRTLEAEEFIRRFLQHVLPDRFVKVRYYGFLAQRNRDKLENVRALLGVNQEEPVGPESQRDDSACASADFLACPKCGGIMDPVGILQPKRRPP